MRLWFLRRVITLENLSLPFFFFSLSPLHAYWCCFEKMSKKLTLVSDQPSGVFLRKAVQNSKCNCWSKVCSSKKKKKNYRWCVLLKEVQLYVLKSFWKTVQAFNFHIFRREKLTRWSLKVKDFQTLQLLI